MWSIIGGALFRRVSPPPGRAEKGLALNRHYKSLSGGWTDPQEQMGN